MMRPDGTFGGGFDSMMPGTANNQSAQAAYRNAQERVQSFYPDLQAYEVQLNRVRDHISALFAEVEVLHRHYDDVMGEKVYLEELLGKAESQLSHAGSVIDRYTVKDAVVASDGFTYERDSIGSYFEHCQKADVKPHSQQTEESLTTTLVPNCSLKKFLARLHEVQQGSAPSPAGNKSSEPRSNTGVAPTATEPVGERGNHSHHEPANTKEDGVVETNALGERVHPCIRVYGFCNYKGSCAYAMYPYDACLSNLKGRCRFRNQCHERHVEFRGPLNDHGLPLSSAVAGGTASEETK